tara:strand:- start:62 stop:616 length:555 start_codon:yes stop_codon:yes gene_type:complete
MLGPVAGVIGLLVYRFHPVRHGFGCDGAGYGCWFFEHDGETRKTLPVLVVNVSNPLLLRDKSEAYPFIDATVSAAEVGRVLAPCHRDPRCNSRHSEPGLCAAALKKGYDSVRMPVRTARNASVAVHEWVVCRGRCLTHTSCDACPDVVVGPCSPACCKEKPPSTRWKEALRHGKALVRARHQGV